MRTREDLDPQRLALFGLGGTGAGNAIYGAAYEPRVRAVAVQTVVADGADWLHRMRREHEWVAFRERVEQNRLQRALGAEGEFVDPREDLMVATPERRAARAGSPNEMQIELVNLASAEALLRYRPLDVVDRVAPRALLITAVEDDVVTPEDHAMALFRRAGSPKRLVRRLGVKHYDSYLRNYDLLLGEILSWFERYLAPRERVSAASEEAAEIVEISRPPRAT